MDLLYGILLLLILIPFTYFLVKIMDIIPTQYYMAIVPLMLFGDTILTFFWVYGFIDFVNITKIFVSGLGIAFFVNMLYKIFLILKFQKNNF